MGRHYARKRRLCERHRCRRPSSRCLPIQEIAPTSDLGRGRSPRTSSLATSDHPLGGLAISCHPSTQVVYPWKRSYKAIDNSVMDLATPWYRRGGTSMESSILCSHRGKALVMKGVEEVENAEVNSKY
ncbi:hypothetical protein BHM03_00054397 [Ensete ventricosum]|nr:hypothetical protein BHM03_00054397 [Ensete ventricosum]